MSSEQEREGASVRQKKRYSQDIDENGDYNPISDAEYMEQLNQQAEGLPLKEDWSAEDYEKEFN